MTQNTPNKSLPFIRSAVKCGVIWLVIGIGANIFPKSVVLAENINGNLGVLVETSQQTTALYGRGFVAIAKGAVEIAKGAVDIAQRTTNYVGNAYKSEIYSIQKTPENKRTKEQKASLTVYDQCYSPLNLNGEEFELKPCAKMIGDAVVWAFKRAYVEGGKALDKNDFEKPEGR